MSDGTKVLPVNPKVKDRLFHKIYECEEYLNELAHFLLGVEVDEVKLSNVEPIML